MGRCWWDPWGYSGPRYEFAYPISAEREKDFLHDQAQSLKEQLGDIEARLSELENKEN